MDLSEFMKSILSFAQGDKTIVVVLTLGALLFLYRKPKVFFGTLFFGLFLAGILYLITSVAGSGREQKNRMIHEKVPFSLEPASDLTGHTDHAADAAADRLMDGATKPM